MEHLTQSFSYILWLGQDSWECHPRFIASKISLNPQVSNSPYVLLLSLPLIEPLFFLNKLRQFNYFI
jgi:hypothetical protein